MSDSQEWLNHLSSSLRANRQLAYLCRVEEDKYEFIGDVMGILGVAEDEVPTTKDALCQLIDPEDLILRQLALADVIAKSKDGERSFTLNYKLKRATGAALPVVETGVALWNRQSGKTTIQSLMAIDSETIERQKKMSRRMGFREEVSSVFTGNSERRKLIQEMEVIQSQPERDITRGYLILVSVDRLSMVNEIYGANFAEELLEKIDGMLHRICSDEAKVMRVNGDVFALLFSQSPQGLMEETSRSILGLFYSQPIAVQERLIHQIVSMGGVRIGETQIGASSLLGRAELALKDAKRKGRGCFVEYSERLDEEVKNFKNALSIGDGFLRAFRDGRVKIAFQNIISSRTHDVSFYECLIRLVDEEGEVHTAGRFIEAVEKMGLTRLVDTFATQQAIQELKNFPQISLSVNVSNHTLTDPDWLKTMMMELRDYPDVARRLIVEITESVAMSDVNHTMRVVRALQDLGCRIALDDFGAGATAFTQLKDLSLDIVKIDKSFVRDMDKEENKLFIKTLHSLAASMNLETVGEGAETLAEADSLTRDGIDHIQGFVHGLPSMERLWLKK